MPGSNVNDDLVASITARASSIASNRVNIQAEPRSPLFSSSRKRKQGQSRLQRINARQDAAFAGALTPPGAVQVPPRDEPVDESVTDPTARTLSFDIDRLEFGGNKASSPGAGPLAADPGVAVAPAC